MKFKEEGIKINANLVINKRMIYFLCKGDEVVYVGKTEAGLSRITQHRDKEFDTVFILPVDEEISRREFAFLETQNIIKYNPKYNKRIGDTIYVSSAIKNIQKLIKNDEFDMTKLGKILINNNINTLIDKYGNLSIRFEDYKKIILELEKC